MPVTHRPSVKPRLNSTRAEKCVNSAYTPLCPIRLFLKCLKRLLEDILPQRFFLLRRQIRIA